MGSAPIVVAPVRRLFVTGLIWVGLAVLALAVGVSTGLFPPALLGAILLRGGFGAYLIACGKSAKRNPARSLVVARVFAVLLPVLIVAGMILSVQTEGSSLHTSLYTREPTIFVPEYRIAEIVLVRSPVMAPAETILGASPYDFEMFPMLGLLLAFVAGLTVALARRRRRTPIGATAAPAG